MPKIVYDYSKLLGRMREMNYTQNVLSNRIGISEASLNSKLGNKVDFKQNEITRICNVLDITPELVTVYFFTKALQISKVLFLLLFFRYQKKQVHIMTTKKVYNIDEVAEMLQTSHVTVRGLIKKGYLKAFKLGRYLIRDKDIDDFLESAVGKDFTGGEPVSLCNGGVQ